MTTRVDPPQSMLTHCSFV